jgi:hypothetical protein
VTLLSVPPPDAGAMVHVTPICVESFCTVAVSTWVVPAGTLAESGAMDTVIGTGGCA